MSSLENLPRPTKIEETVLVTHMGCMDGAGCAILFLAAGGKEENIKFVTAGQVERFIKEDPVIHSEKFLIFADVGLTRPEYADKLEKRGNCVLIDHHRTTLHMKDREWCHVDAEHNGGSACGSELFRQYLALKDQSFKEAHLCRFIQLIDDFDRFLQKEPESERMAMFMSFVGQKEFISKFRKVKNFFPWDPDTDTRKFTWPPECEYILYVLNMRKEENIRLLLKKVVKKEIFVGGKGVKVGYLISSEPNISVLLNEVLVVHPDLDAACQVQIDRGYVSLRSRNGYDVSEMAKYFGGGGHQGAAGHQIPQHIVNEIIEDIHGF